MSLHGTLFQSNMDINDWGVAVVGNGVTIGKGAKVAPKAMVDTDIGGAE